MGKKGDEVSTNNKKRFMQYMSDPNCNLEFRDICSEINIDIKIALKWLEDDDFFDDIMKRFHKINRYCALELLKKLNGMANEGDIKAIKLLIEIQNKTINERVENVEKVEKVVIIDDI